MEECNKTLQQQNLKNVDSIESIRITHFYNKMVLYLALQLCQESFAGLEHPSFSKRLRKPLVCAEKALLFVCSVLGYGCFSRSDTGRTPTQAVAACPPGLQLSCEGPKGPRQGCVPTARGSRPAPRAQRSSALWG